MDREKRESEKTAARNKLKPGFLAKLLPCSFEEIYCRKAVLLAVVSLLIAMLITPSFTTDNPSLRLGDISDRNIKAKRDFLIEDEEATAKKREEAVRQSVIVYDLDEALSGHIAERLDNAFNSMRTYLAGLESQTLPGISKEQLASAPTAPENLSSLVLSRNG